MPRPSDTEFVDCRRVNAAEASALLKILALGNQQVRDGNITSVANAVARIRAKRAAVRRAPS